MRAYADMHCDMHLEKRFYAVFPIKLASSLGLTSHRAVLFFKVASENVLNKCAEQLNKA